MYSEDVDKSFHPNFLTKITNFEKFAEEVFAKSIFASKDKLKAFLENPKAETLEQDMAFVMAMEISKLIDSINGMNVEAYAKLERGNRLFIAGVREMNPVKLYYPNANSTMRLTYGQVLEYAPRDGVKYLHYTTLDGVMEKEDPNNFEFLVPKKLRELWEKKDYGRYAENGTLPTCFISNNDITGGNSGSPVIDGEGRLVGLAFDGNWEAMCDKIAFEPNLQRCINMDIRYVLFCIEKLGGAKHIVDEMTIVEDKKK
jgi:hypothetical protein